MEVKETFDKSMQTIRDDMELKYKDTLRENRRETVHLELELEKEKNRVQGYRQAIASQSQQLMEERRRLSQEREALTGEKSRLLQAGGAGALLHTALERESEWHRGAIAALREVEEGLVERQGAFCSILVPREKRLEMEKDLLVRAGRERALAQLDMDTGLKDIFKNDRNCAQYLNTDKRKNGSLMWIYLRYWQLQVTLQKHRRAEATLLGTQSSNL